jgi:hypothetical protein
MRTSPRRCAEALILDGEQRLTRVGTSASATSNRRSSNRESQGVGVVEDGGLGHLAHPAHVVDWAGR